MHRRGGDRELVELFGPSKLSVWWLRLGIKIQRIKPGNPQQNGRHERMHLTLKHEATKPASFNFLQQQERFDRFVEVYNSQRPHQALDMRYPADLYHLQRAPIAAAGSSTTRSTIASAHASRGCGRICFGRRKINLSNVLRRSERRHPNRSTDHIWLVSFMTTIWLLRSG